ncbi:MAG: hypothetical protein OXI88_22580 [Gammaproteobacteria bacterium]|nr:hypothetical protein [Gammaproteobacteria bacterium]
MTADKPENLFERLKQKEPESLLPQVEHVDKLGEDDLEDRKRATDYVLDKHWKTKVGPYLNWAKFWLIVIVSVFLFSCAGFVIWNYLWEIRGNTEAVADLLKGSIDLVLIAFATLFVERLVRKK